MKEAVWYNFACCSQFHYRSKGTTVLTKAISRIRQIASKAEEKLKTVKLDLSLPNDKVQQI